MAAEIIPFNRPLTHGREDSLIHLSNAVTGMGNPRHDPSMANQVVGPLGELLSQYEEQLYYRGFKVCRRVCDMIPSHMTARWMQLTMGGPDGSAELINEMMDLMAEMPVDLHLHEYLGVSKAFELAQQFANRTGNAGVILYVNDGVDDYSKPIDYENLKSIDGMRILDKWSIRPEFYGAFKRSQHFRLVYQPLLFDHRGLLMSGRGLVHKSRVLWFRGEEVGEQSLNYTQGCDDSVLGAFLAPFLRKEKSIQGAARMLDDFDVFIHGIEDLYDKLDGDDGAVYAGKMYERLRINKLSKSLWKMIAYDKDSEDLGTLTRQVSGYSDLMEKVLDDMLSATDLQPSELLNQYPGGMSNTSKTEQENTNRRTRFYQSQKFDAPLRKFMKLLWRCKRGPTRGKVPSRFGIDWQELYPMTPLELSELELNYTQVDDSNIRNEVYSGDDVVESRYSGDKFNPQMTVDLKRRKQKAQASSEYAEEDDYNFNDDYNFDSARTDSYSIPPIPTGVKLMARNAMKDIKTHFAAIARRNVIKIGPIVRALAQGRPLTHHEIDDMRSLVKTYSTRRTPEAEAINMLLGDREGRDWIMGKPRRLDSVVRSEVNKTMQRIYRYDSEPISVTGDVLGVDDYGNEIDPEKSESDWQKMVSGEFSNLQRADARKKASETKSGKQSVECGKGWIAGDKECKIGKTQSGQPLNGRSAKSSGPGVKEAVAGAGALAVGAGAIAGAALLAEEYSKDPDGYFQAVVGNYQDLMTELGIRDVAPKISAYFETKGLSEQELNRKAQMGLDITVRAAQEQAGQVENDNPNVKSARERMQYSNTLLQDDRRAEQYKQALASVAGRKKMPPYPEELAAIYYYSDTVGYKEMNMTLRGQDEGLQSWLKEKGDTRSPEQIKKEAERDIDMAISGLEQLPAYEGETYRGLELPDDVIGSIEVGKDWVEPGLTSTTKKSTMRYPGNTVFVVKGKGSGRDISDFEKYANKEVLYPPGARFTVTTKRKVKKLGKEFWLVEMEENLSRTDSYLDGDPIDYDPDEIGQLYPLQNDERPDEPIPDNLRSQYSENETELSAEEPLEQPTEPLQGQAIRPEDQGSEKPLEQPASESEQEPAQGNPEPEQPEVGGNEGTKEGEPQTEQEEEVGGNEGIDPNGELSPDQMAQQDDRSFKERSMDHIRQIVKSASMPLTMDLVNFAQVAAQEFASDPISHIGYMTRFGRLARAAFTKRYGLEPDIAAQTQTDAMQYLARRMTPLSSHIGDLQFMGRSQIALMTGDTQMDDDPVTTKLAEAVLSQAKAYTNKMKRSGKVAAFKAAARVKKLDGFKGLSFVELQQPQTQQEIESASGRDGSAWAIPYGVCFVLGLPHNGVLRGSPLIPPMGRIVAKAAKENLANGMNLGDALFQGVNDVLGVSNDEQVKLRRSLARYIQDLKMVTGANSLRDEDE